MKQKDKLFETQVQVQVQVSSPTFKLIAAQKWWEDIIINELILCSPILSSETGYYWLLNHRSTNGKTMLRTIQF